MSTGSNGAVRESGTVEKLLHSYGFVRCTDRRGRLFFHYSHFLGNIETLRIGDAVEFQMVTDRKSGKPIATNMIRFGAGTQAPTATSPQRSNNNNNNNNNVNGVVNGGENVASDGVEYILGTVTSLPTDDQQGRVAYSSRGECFFLAWRPCECALSSGLNVGDDVQFLVTAGEDGVWEACHVHALAKPSLLGEAPPTNGTAQRPYQGVVCSLKESFGFLERADIVKEIFFHASECAQWDELRLGDDVGFDIQIRNGKEVAVGVERLSPGTVIFEDISDEVCTGRLTKLSVQYRGGANTTEPLSGRIQPDDGGEPLPWGDRDPLAEYTLLVGDTVQYQVATDRRDHLRRATRIRAVIDESHPDRRQGVIGTLKEQFGFIICDSDESGSKEIYFRRNELIDEAPPQSGQHVRFQVIPDTHGTSNGGSGGSPRLQAVRIVRVAAPLVESPQRRHRGYIAALKESFGFIEDVTHKRDIFFHYSMYNGKPSELYLGLPVEFSITHKGHKQSAEDVKAFFGGSENGGGKRRSKQKAITNSETGLVDAWEPNVVLDPEVLTGTVERTLRMFQPNQEEYTGIIAYNPTPATANEGEVLASETAQANAEDAAANQEVIRYEFCVMSLSDLSDCISPGDVVQFRVARSSQSRQVIRAACIKPVREVKQAVVEAIKGQFGFLTYETAEGKRLFFHMSEVQGGVKLKVMDTVKFVLVKNHRNGKSSACHIERIAECAPSPRPQHLINRVRGVSNAAGGWAAGGGVTAIRTPKGPEEGAAGFGPEHRDRMMALAVTCITLQNGNATTSPASDAEPNSDTNDNPASVTDAIAPANATFEENTRAVSVTA